MSQSIPKIFHIIILQIVSPASGRETICSLKKKKGDRDIHDTICEPNTNNIRFCDQLTLDMVLKAPQLKVKSSNLVATPTH